MGVIHDLALKLDITGLQREAKENGKDYLRLARNLHNQSLLHIACQLSFIPLIQYSLDIGVDVNAHTVSGDTPLIISTKLGHLDAVKMLIEAGANVDDSNIHGNTALHYACFWRYTEIALFLVKTCSAHIQIMNSYQQTPLHQTSKVLKETLQGIAVNRGDKAIQAKSNSGQDIRQMVDNSATKSWIIPSTDISILESLSETDNSYVNGGLWGVKEVAIKIPKCEIVVSEKDFNLMASEIAAIRKIVHPNLLTVYAASLTPPDVFYVMPYMPNGNLQSMLMDSSIDMTPEQAIRLSVQICKGLIALHEAKPVMFHGNLKTTNVLVAADKSLMLSDFGFHKSLFNHRISDPICISQPEWMAPESLMGIPIDDQRITDIYSFGLVFHSIITRQPLFEITNPMVLGYKIALEKLKPDIPQFLPLQLVTIMNLCWNEDPMARPTIRTIYNHILQFKF